MDKQYGPIIALVLGGILLIAGGQADKFVGPVSPLSNTLQGTLLLCITEKTKPSVSEVIAIRDASEFVKTHGFKGYFYLDDDDPTIQSIIAAAGTKDIQSPMLIPAKIEDGKINKLERVRSWTNGLEDILK